MELQNGRPSNQAGRLEKEIRTYDLLDKLHVSYQRIDHEAAETMEICAEIDKVLEATICKNLFLCNRQNTNFYLLMILLSLSLLFLSDSLCINQEYLYFHCSLFQDCYNS